LPPSGHGDAARRIVPGASYLVTRRCSERRFFLRPSRLTNEVVLYVLAVAARRFGVLVHAFCVLSNHLHLLVTDPDARLPAFMQYLDSLVARAVNATSAIRPRVA
jgi:REP element-mobilizing transposase RayT